jgi:hypothetical protein
MPRIPRMRFRIQTKKVPLTANTDGMGNCLQQPGLLRNQPHKSMHSKFYPLIKFVYRDYSCYRDNVNRAAGRRAVVMVFASPSGQFYHDVTTSFHLPGLSHLDNFIVTRKSCPLTGTLQKRMPTPTQTATPHTTGPLSVRMYLPDDYRCPAITTLMIRHNQKHLTFI